MYDYIVIPDVIQKDCKTRNKTWMYKVDENNMFIIPKPKQQVSAFINRTENSKGKEMTCVKLERNDDK